MLDVLSDYIETANTVLEETPILRLERLLKKDHNISPGEITQLSVRLNKQWNNYAKYGLEMCIVLTEEECKGQELIHRYDFSKDIEKIIKGSCKSSNIYYLNCRYEVSEIDYTEDRITVEQCSDISKETERIVLHLGVKGVDVFIDGILFQSDNFLSSYKDVMYVREMLEISNYEKLLHGFYLEDIQYDRNKRYFLQRGDIPKEYHANTIDKYTKLLKNRPEKYFQLDFIKYLKNHCCDTVIKEYANVTEDRYDVLVLDEENQVYVFEIKWLGCSITTKMNIFEKYNTSERAISGAYQLLDYVSNADKYSEYFLEYPVCCAVLLVFDAREENTEIDYPEKIVRIPNIDLSKRLFIEKEKVSASEVYSDIKR